MLELREKVEKPIPPGILIAARGLKAEIVALTNWNQFNHYGINRLGFLCLSK